MPKETIVATGMGVIAPIGENVSTYAEGLKNGRDGCAPTRFDVSADVYATRNGMASRSRDDVLERFDPLKWRILRCKARRLRWRMRNCL